MRPIFVMLIAGITLLPTSAKAHSWYDKECCSGDDCAPVADGGIKEGPGGYTLPDGNLLPYGDKRIRQSVDHQFHWCHINAATYCLYVPGRGI